MERPVYPSSERSELSSQLAVSAQEGNGAAVEELIVLLEPMMRKLLRPLNLRSAVHDEFMQELRLEVFRCLPKYREEKAAFSTWVWSRFRGVIQHLLYEYSDKPVSEKRFRDAKSLEKEVEIYYAETGNRWINGDLLERMNAKLEGRMFTREKVERLLADVSRQVMVFSELGAGYRMAVLNAYTDPEQGVQLAETGLKERITEFVKSIDLTAAQRETIDARYFRKDKEVPGHAQVAKELGFCHYQVTQNREKGALKKIRERVKYGVLRFEDYLDRKAV